MSAEVNMTKSRAQVFSGYGNWDGQYYLRWQSSRSAKISFLLMDATFKNLKKKEWHTLLHNIWV